MTRPDRHVRPVRALLADDEALARRRLRALLADDSRIVIVGEADTGNAAVKLLRELDVDLVFLDIQMPGLDGFGVLRAVPVDELPLVVFITAYDEHAVKAFDVSAVDYVLKPVVESRFRLAVDRAIERLARPRGEITAAVMTALETLARPAESERIPIRTERGVTFIRATDLDWAEVDGSTVRLHVGRDTHIIREAMGDFEQRVSGRRFLRIHRSRLVNLDRVKEVQPWFKGDFVLILHDGTRLVSGRTYRDRVRELLR
jgi:two-component system, LytTR family, response regulator